MWEVVAVILGLALIATEILVIPGTGFTGFIGVAFLFVGMIGTFISGDLQSADGQAQLLTGLGVMLGGGVLAAIISWFIVRYLGGATAIHKLILEDASGDHQSIQRHSHEDHLSVGTIGVAITDLRPSGRIKINGNLFDATTTGQWISEGSTVRIMHTGLTLEVEEAEL
jgi:membrane-bound serine protease (ClpP class)